MPMSMSQMLSRQSLKEYAYQLAARREYCVEGLRKKLSDRVFRQLRKAACDEHVACAWEDSPLPADYQEDIDDIVTELVDKNFLSDDRFVNQWIRAHRTRYGSGRMLFELRQLGIKAPLLESRRSWLAATEQAACFMVWQKKFGKLAESPKEIQKQKQFLAQRGFDFETISATLHDIRHERFPQTDHLFEEFEPA